MKRKWLLMAFFYLATMTASVLASSFHLMKIKEFFPGCAAAPNAQYIELQMYFAFQNLVSGKQVRVFDSTGALIATFTFPSDVTNGADQATILLATAEAQTFFSLTADMTITPAISLPGGKICFFDPPPFGLGDIDCVSWGNYSGSSVGTGTPFSQTQGLKLGRAVRRRLDLCSSPTNLDFCDDTDNSNNDFVFATPAPRNNAGTNGTIPPATCGNGIIEGLEECDDSNLVAGDGCDPTCLIEPPACANSKGDMNGDVLYTAADVVLLLNCTFAGAGSCDICFSDVNCDLLLTAADVVLELNKVFVGTNTPPWCGP